MKNKSNILWQQHKVKPTDRETRNNHKAAIVWLTGLPAAGKTSIALALEEHLFAQNINTYILDGDNIRHGLNKDLGFSPSDRKENIRRIAETAKLFVDAGFIIITSFISPYRADRDFARGLVEKGQFIEVFLDCPVEECERRDPKGHYKKARAGEIKDFTGVSAPYEAPKNPEIHVKTNTNTIEETCGNIVDYLQKMKIISPV